MLEQAIKFNFLFSACLLLSGCVLVPGSNINLDNYRETEAWFESDGVWFPGFRKAEAEAAEAELASLVDIVSITPELLSTEIQLTEATVPDAVPAIQSEQLQTEIENYQYHIARGDVLYVTVYDHPELTNPSGANNNLQDFGNIVQFDGTIYYPYIGTVQVEGLNVQQVREIISQQLAEFITAPQVDVRVSAYNSKRVYVTGQVGSPGPQILNNIPLTVLDAIVNAGGLSESANWHNVLLSRNGAEIRLSVYEMLNNGRLGENMLLQHGDILHVPELGDQQIFMLGEIGAVNALPMGNLRISLTEALTRSGSLDQVTSDARGVFVIRQEPAGSEKLATVYQLDVRNAIAFAVGTRFILQPMDIIYVTTAPVTLWNRVLNQILPSVSAFFTLSALGNI